ncbi:MAG: Gfo/Idh/MocA family protein [Ignavibacteriaceae bacterium]
MIRIGLVGTGYISGVHALAAKEVENVSITSVFSRDKKRVKKFAEKFGIPNYFDNYDSFLDSNIDAVIICLPTPLHKDYSIEALNRSKHVLCEKPMALNIDDGIEMKNTAEKTGRVLMVAHVLRFWPEYVIVKKILEDGLVGNIRKVITYRFASLPEWSSNNWLLDQNKSGGVPVDLQLHDIDFIFWLLGEPKKYYSVGICNPDGLIVNSSAIFQYENATAIAEAGYILAKDFRFEMGFKIITDSVIFDYYNLREPTLLIEKAGKTPEAVQFEYSNSYSKQISYFVECIIQNNQPEQIKLSDAIKSLQFSIDIKSSILLMKNLKERII